jgi:hypothetical protein
MIYAITYKTKNKTRINISDSYKIMINSHKVYLVIIRQYPEVGNKNIFIFGYKKSFRQIHHKFKINHIKRFAHQLSANCSVGPTHGFTHNIYKNQLMITCRFSTTTDLGSTDFNYSCKNYHANKKN